MTAHHAFQASQADTQVSAAPGEVLTVIDDSDANWIKVYSATECKVRA